MHYGYTNDCTRTALFSHFFTPHFAILDEETKAVEINASLGNLIFSEIFSFYNLKTTSVLFCHQQIMHCLLLRFSKYVKDDNQLIMKKLISITFVIEIDKHTYVCFFINKLHELIINVYPDKLNISTNFNLVQRDNKY